MDSKPNDLIRRGDAIETAKDWYNGLIVGSFNGLEKRLKALPSAEPEMQWIPVTERLPEADGEYLVTYEKGYAEDYGFDLVSIAPFEVDCEGFGIWLEDFDHTLGSLGSDWVDIPVTAWMPLPKPYVYPPKDFMNPPEGSEDEQTR